MRPRIKAGDTIENRRNWSNEIRFRVTDINYIGDNLWYIECLRVRRTDGVSYGKIRYFTIRNGDNAPRNYINLGDIA